MEGLFQRRVLLVSLFYRFDDRLKCRGIIHGQIGEYLAVDVDIVGVNLTHELGVRHAVLAGSGVDTLDPQGTESAFLGFAVAVGILQTFFDGVFGNRPYIFTGAPVTLGEFKDLLPSGPGGYMVNGTWHVVFVFWR